MEVVVKDRKLELKIENDEMEIAHNLEEGEISDDDEEITPSAQVESALFDNLTDGQKEETSKRFALIGDLTLAVPKEELKALYQSLGIDEENERHYRFNTIHMRGTNGMKTMDIIEYFSGLEPVSVNWLERDVCNVEWKDEILPARALLYLSVEIVNYEKRFKLSDMMDAESNVGEEITGNVVDASKLKFMLPQGRWRKGTACDISKEIIMRYATNDDKKLLKRHDHERHRYQNKKPKHLEVHVHEAPKDPWGPLAQTWGRGEGVEKHIWSSAPPRNVPDLRSSLNDAVESRFAEVYLRRAAELRREKPPAPPVFFESSSEDSGASDDDTRRRKLPRMRADIEEEKQKLSRLEKVAKSGDLRSRLNHKKAMAVPRSVRLGAGHSDESGDDFSTDWASENYQDFQRTLVNNREKERESLESDSDFDLDEPGEMLQIEVDNEYYQRQRRKP